MSEQIGAILVNRPNEEPAEFKIIRNFVLENYRFTPNLQIRNNSIVIIVPNGAIAGELRMRLHELQAKCNPSKKLTLRIG